MTRVASKTVIFPSDLQEIRAVLRAVLDEVKAQGYNRDAYFAIRLSLDEALTNAVRHGNDNDRDKNVTLEYSVDPDIFHAKITDEGHGFAPCDVPDPTLDENLERPSGRGVMLMRAYMTEVRFNEHGNCVTLVKHSRCPLPSKKQESPGC